MLGLGGTSDQVLLFGKAVNSSFMAWYNSGNWAAWIWGSSRQDIVGQWELPPGGGLGEVICWFTCDGIMLVECWTRDVADWRDKDGSLVGEIGGRWGGLVGPDWWSLHEVGIRVRVYGRMTRVGAKVCRVVVIRDRKGNWFSSKTTCRAIYLCQEERLRH